MMKTPWSARSLATSMTRYSKTFSVKRGAFPEVFAAPNGGIGNRAIEVPDALGKLENIRLYPRRFGKNLFSNSDVVGIDLHAGHMHKRTAFISVALPYFKCQCADAGTEVDDTRSADLNCKLPGQS